MSASILVLLPTEKKLPCFTVILCPYDPSPVSYQQNRELPILAGGSQALHPQWAGFHSCPSIPHPIPEAHVAVLMLQCQLSYQCLTPQTWTF